MFEQKRYAIKHFDEIPQKKLDALKDCLLVGDTLETLRHFSDESIDLFLTSPPYNLKNSSGNGMKDGRGGKWKNAALQQGYDGYDDNMPYDLYCKWQHECLLEMYRCLKNDGAIFYNHKWRVQRGLWQDRHEIVEGLPVRQIIIWHRSGGINFNPGYFLPTYEVIYMICKPAFKLVKGANHYGDVWEIKQDMNNPHPAPFPEELASRVVTSTSAQLICDPFVGSGTTAVAAVKAGRHFIGIDKSEVYCEMAQKRLEGGNWNGRIAHRKYDRTEPVEERLFLCEANAQY